MRVRKLSFITNNGKSKKKFDILVNSIINFHCSPYLLKALPLYFLIFISSTSHNLNQFFHSSANLSFALLFSSIFHHKYRIELSTFFHFLLILIFIRGRDMQPILHLLLFCKQDNSNLY